MLTIIKNEITKLQYICTHLLTENVGSFPIINQNNYE